MRKLYPHEIETLVANGCSSSDWSLLSVHDNFEPNTCCHTTFIGTCTIGDLSGSRPNEFGIPLPNGIRYALIHECNIGDGVRIDHVNDCISRYDIGKDTTISNICTIAMKGTSSFGNGVKVSVLNETGGLEVIITDLLTAHTAYLSALMRDDKALKERLDALFIDYAERMKSDRGKIGSGVTIKNTGSIINARIGDDTTIEGATMLEECSLNSIHEHPVYIGHSVIGHNFIACSGAKLAGACIVHDCFIGQSTHLDRSFSAENSLFFANSRCENGESCAVFAGPYTVTMHKCSLLIAGHFSFLNAGSGSNQSNHLYKLGPMHYGIVERGSKTTSDSYVLWPSHIAPFSLIMGRHVHHVDTSDFPFSYLIENDDESYLVPGANLRSIGTIRDAKKWPQRDRRPSDMRMDCINFNLLSPFTIGKMERGYNKLKELRSYIGHHGKTYIYNNIHIRSSSLEHGLETYSMGIKKFIGNSVIQQMQGHDIRTEEDLRACLLPQLGNSSGEWIDVCGLIAPRTLVDEIIADIKSGKYASLADVNEAFRALHRRYYSLEWEWSYGLMCRWYGIERHEEITSQLIARIVTEWMEAVIRLDHYLYNDADKEYAIIGRVNFGIKNGNGAPQNRPEILKKEMEDSPIVHEVLDHIRRKRELGETTLAMLRGIRP